MAATRFSRSLLLASSLLLAACGGGDSSSDNGDESPNTPATTAPTEVTDQPDESSGADNTDDAPAEATPDEVPAEVASDDGVLTLIQTGDPIDVTIDAVEGFESEFEGLVPLFAYELGPDGTVFDEPVQVRLAVTPEQLAGGVVAAVRSSDGTIEGLPLDVIEEDGADVVVSKLTHFSTVEIYQFTFHFNVEIDLPAVMQVGASAPLGLRTDDVLDEYAAFAQSRSIDQWTFSPPLSPGGSYNVTCSVAEGAGIGAARFEGHVDIENDGTLYPFAERGVAYVTETVDVECVQPTPIEFLDQRCTDYSTGEESNECSFPESVSCSGAADEPCTFEIFVPADAAGGEPPVVDLSVYMAGDEGLPILLELGSDGKFNGFAEQGFENFTPGDEMSGRLELDDSGTTYYVFVDGFVGDAGTYVLDVAPSETFSGNPVEGGVREITELSVFIESGNTFSTTLLDIDDVIGHSAP